jgi:putative FmdB family regulatory protein
MPIYEYRCEGCGQKLEKLQKVSDPPLTDCPACGRQTLKKVISPVGFRLKGSGWYETDFKKGDKKKNLPEAGEKSSEKKEGSTSGDDKKEKAGGEGKSETKAKPETKSTAAGA